MLTYHPYDQLILTPAGFDGTFYPPDMEQVPKRFAIVRANHWMVDHTPHLIAYVWHPASNAKELLEYAHRRERRGLIRIENLATISKSYQRFVAIIISNLSISSLTSQN